MVRILVLGGVALLSLFSWKFSLGWFLCWCFDLARISVVCWFVLLLLSWLIVVLVLLLFGCVEYLG